jgi:quercetin dioxygenase-like cupin family protein
MTDHPPAIERLDDAIRACFLAMAPRADTLALALPAGEWETFPLADPRLARVEWRREPSDAGFQCVRFRSFGESAMGEHFHEYPEILTQIHGTLTLTHNGETKTLQPGESHWSGAGEMHSARYGKNGGETLCKWRLDEPAVVCKVFPDQ